MTTKGRIEVLEQRAARTHAASVVAYDTYRQAAEFGDLLLAADRASSPAEPVLGVQGAALIAARVAELRAAWKHADAAARAADDLLAAAIAEAEPVTVTP